MDPGSQNDSDRGGGRHAGSPSSTGSTSALHDEGRSQLLPLQTTSASIDSGLNGGQRSYTPPLLSLDQIKISGSSNEYTEGPKDAQMSQQQKADLVRTSGQHETLEERRQNLHNLHALAQHGTTINSISSEMEDSLNSARTSVGSTSTDPRHFGSPANSDQIITIQPKRTELNSEELKPLNCESIPVSMTLGSATNADRGTHTNKCEYCGRCTCHDCRQPRVLPSCWMCGKRCICSAKSTVEHWTCVCCVKGLFYHCSSDDEDTCVDKPFSCSQSHCCVRWTTVTLLSLFLPCLLCYLPAKGCVELCQCCYDQVTRPGCRCKNPTPQH